MIFVFLWLTFTWYDNLWVPSMLLQMSLFLLLFHSFVCVCVCVLVINHCVKLDIQGPLILCR